MAEAKGQIFRWTSIAFLTMNVADTVFWATNAYMLSEKMISKI